MVLDSRPLGHHWSSSKLFILSVVVLALFCETFLYGFVVPILSYMLEGRLHVDPSQTQNITTALLSLHGLIALISAPIIAHFADKTPKRKLPLLISLIGCLVGTLLLSFTPSIPALFFGRILQGISGSATWIVGSATLTEHVGVENLGKLYGLSMSFASAGIVTGPVIAGAVLELAGYWPAWSVPLGLLAFDIIMRFIMTENPNPSFNHPNLSTVDCSDTNLSNEETASLLADCASTYQTRNSDAVSETYHDTRGFYRIMLADARVITGLANTILNSALLAGFDTTLTLHLRDTFGWRSLKVGMMFLCLQLPFILFGSVAGWLRDRNGLRYPTAIGWAILAPVMWLMGIPKADLFPSRSIINGEGMFIFAVVMFGVVAPFL
ncbi:unnamed protein product [Penicillium crustosum]